MSSKSINLMTSYFINRQQSVYFNSSTSNLLPIGDNSVFQGTLMATLLYVLYVLDQPAVAHIMCVHELNNYEIEICPNNFSQNFVDDSQSEIQAENWNDIENQTNIFLNNQQKYHNNNKLLFNHTKLLLCLILRKKETKTKQ